MIELELKNGVWEISHGGAIQHYGTLGSCGKYIQQHAEEMEEWETR